MAIECIQRKKSVRYRAVVRLGGKKFSKTFRRKIDAREWEGMYPGFHNAFPSNVATITLNELMARFETDHLALRNAPSTQIMTRSLYDNYLKSTFGNVSLQELTTQTLETYFIHLRNEKNVSGGRVNRVRTLLHVMFGRGVKWKVLSANPASQVERLPDRNDFNTEDTHFLSKGEAAKLLEWLRINDPWLYPKIVVLLHTGIRFGEMCALRPRDIRLSTASSHLIVSQSRCRHTGKFVLPKGKRTRIIPLSRNLAEFFQTQIEGKQQEDPALWKNWDEGRWPTKAYKHFQKALSETKVTRITLHDLRHTFAVRFLENGGQLYTLKELLGHRDIKLTMRYLHFSPAMAEQARGVVEFERPTPQLTVVDGGVR